MVLSIMGLFGVHLDPRKFDKNDRHTATIRLLQELMKRGHRDEWLGLMPNIDTTGGRMSTIPIMPESTVEGIAFMTTRIDGPRAIETLFDDSTEGMLWWIDGAPTGSIDELGNLTTSLKFFPLLKRTDLDLRIVVDASRWDKSLFNGSCGLDIKRNQYYKHGSADIDETPNPTLLMLVAPESSRGTVDRGIFKIEPLDYRISGSAWLEKAPEQTCGTKEFILVA